MRIFDTALNLLFPPKCPFCGRILEKREECLCPDCWRDLPWLVGAAGERPIAGTTGCITPLHYEGRVRNAIHAYKFDGKDARGWALGMLVARWVTDYGLDVELVSWPPLPKERLRERGYDQSKILAEVVGKQLGLPMVRTLRKRNIPAQSSLSSKDDSRRINVAGAYSVLKPEVFQGKKLLLVDDVVTTGSTLCECAKVLRKAGAGTISCVALANAR